MPTIRGNKWFPLPSCSTPPCDCDLLFGLPLPLQIASFPVPWMAFAMADGGAVPSTTTSWSSSFASTVFTPIMKKKGEEKETPRGERQGETSSRTRAHESRVGWFCQFVMILDGSHRRQWLMRSEGPRRSLYAGKRGKEVRGIQLTVDGQHSLGDTLHAGVARQRHGENSLQRFEPESQLESMMRGRGEGRGDGGDKLIRSLQKQQTACLPGTKWRPFSAMDW